MCQKCAREQRRGLFLPQAATRTGPRVARVYRPQYLHALERLSPHVLLQLVSHLGWIDGLDILRLVSSSLNRTFGAASEDFWLMCAQVAHSQCLLHINSPIYINASVSDEQSYRAMQAMVVTLQDPLDDENYYHAFPDAENEDYSWKDRLGLAQRKARWARTQARNAAWLSSGCSIVSNCIFATNNIVLVLQRAQEMSIDGDGAFPLLAGAELEAQVWRASGVPMHRCASGALAGAQEIGAGSVVCVVFPKPETSSSNASAEVAALTQLDVQQALTCMFELISTPVAMKAMQLRLPPVSAEMPYEVYYLSYPPLFD